MARCDGWLSTTDGVTPDARRRRMGEHRRPRVTFAPSRCWRRDGGGTRLEAVLGHPRQRRPRSSAYLVQPSATQRRPDKSLPHGDIAALERAQGGVATALIPPASDAHDRVESSHRRASPTGPPIAQALAPSIVAQRPRSSESAPQRGSRSPIISLIPPGGNAHYASETCPAFMLQSTEPRQLPHRRAEYSHASKRRSGESALQRGRKHPSFRLVSYAHNRSDTWLAFILHSTEPSRLRPRMSPIAGPDRACGRATYCRRAAPQR
jgi:hypothetical protein